MMQFECFSKFELDTKKKSLLYFFIRRVVHFHPSFFSKDIIFYIIKLEKLPSIRSFYLQEVHKIIQKYLQVYISIDYFAYSLNHRSTSQKHGAKTQIWLVLTASPPLSMVEQYRKYPIKAS